MNRSPLNSWRINSAKLVRGQGESVMTLTGTLEGLSFFFGVGSAHWSFVLPKDEPFVVLRGSDRTLIVEDDNDVLEA